MKKETALSLISNAICFTGKRIHPAYIIIILAYLLPQHVFGMLDTAVVRTYGGPGSEIGRDIQVTVDSGFILVGTTNEYGPGNTSIYLVRTDAAGNHRWSTVLGGSRVDCGYGVRTSYDGGFVICGFTNSFGAGGYDGYVVKTDSLGNKVFDKTYGGTDWDFLYGMASLPDSGYILCGQTYSYTNGGSDGYMIRIDKNGDTLWTRHTGGIGDEILRAVILLDSNLYFCGETTTTGAGDKDGYLVKTDLLGNIIYEKQYNFMGEDYFTGIASTLSRKLIFSGSTAISDTSHRDVWIQQYDTAGSPGWTRFDPSHPEDDYANDLVVLNNGDIFYVGEKNPSGLGNKCMFTDLLDSNGIEHTWYSFGGSRDEEGYRCCLIPSHGIASVGYTTSYGIGNEDACIFLLQTDTLVLDYFYTPVVYTENLSPIGILEPVTLTKNIVVYPNPVQHELYFETSAGSFVSSFELYSFQGSLVLKKNLGNNFKNQLSLDGIEPGLYYFKIFDQSGQCSGGKLVIF